jgi:hypothetical protein
MRRHHLWLNGAVAFALLGGVVLDRQLLHVPSGNADAYHLRVRTAAAAMPVHVGNWFGQDVPVLPGAVALLRPNVVMERRYRNVATGQEASFLLVQCRDARDLIGHYPPICYKANGYQMLSCEPDARKIQTLPLNGTTYEFSSAKLAMKGAMKVFDLMILPNGQTAPDMNGVYSIARDRRQRHFGAAQIQILTDSAMSEEDRTKVIQTLLAVAQPVIEAIRAGVPQ